MCKSPCQRDELSSPDHPSLPFEAGFELRLCVTAEVSGRSSHRYVLVRDVHQFALARNLLSVMSECPVRRRYLHDTFINRGRLFQRREDQDTALAVSYWHGNVA